jgi:hypothetical protein
MTEAQKTLKKEDIMTAGKNWQNSTTLLTGQMNISSFTRAILRRHKSRWLWVQFVISIMLLVLSIVPAAAGNHDNDYQENEQPFGATAIIIETTDNDIELQVFVDGTRWKTLEIFTPDDRRIFNLRTRQNFRRQGGLSELYFASEPTHYLEDEPNFDGTIEEFLARFPEGVYEFEGRTGKGREIEGEATLTHVLPALPEIIAPVMDGDDPPILDPNNIVIEWEPVTTRFIGEGSVEIVEYQVIIDQDEPLRETPWVDGTNRRALINLPATVTSLKVPPEFLLPNTNYNFEILAIEVSGNSTISEGEFVTSE